LNSLNNNNNNNNYVNNNNLGGSRGISGGGRDLNLGNLPTGGVTSINTFGGLAGLGGLNNLGNFGNLGGTNSVRSRSGIITPPMNPFSSRFNQDLNSYIGNVLQSSLQSNPLLG
jgi:hypothetical protein